MNIDEIKEYLPHRYPFLLVDKIVEVSEEKIVGYKNVTVNEPFFQGHFPQYPIMPGVLLVEALAQCGGAGLMKVKNAKNKLLMFAGLDKVKFRNPVRPGDVLRLEVELIRFSTRIVRQSGKIYIGEKLACEAEWTALVSEPQF